jgi:hypothetical protein
MCVHERLAKEREAVNLLSRITSYVNTDILPFAVLRCSV